MTSSTDMVFAMGAPDKVAAVNSVVDTLSRGFANGDVDELMSVFVRDPDDRFVVFDFSPPLMDIGWSRAYAKSEAFFRQFDKGADIRWLDRRVTVSGDLAFVAARLECKAQTTSGDAIDIVGRSTIVLQNMSGRWLIVHEHDSCV